MAIQTAEELTHGADGRQRPVPAGRRGPTVAITSIAALLFSLDHLAATVLATLIATLLPRRRRARAVEARDSAEILAAKIELAVRVASEHTQPLIF